MTLPLRLTPLRNRRRKSHNGTRIRPSIPSLEHDCHDTGLAFSFSALLFQLCYYTCCDYTTVFHILLCPRLLYNLNEQLSSCLPPSNISLCFPHTFSRKGILLVNLNFELLFRNKLKEFCVIAATFLWGEDIIFQAVQRVSQCRYNRFR